MRISHWESSAKKLLQLESLNDVFGTVNSDLFSENSATFYTSEANKREMWMF